MIFFACSTVRTQRSHGRQEEVELQRAEDRPSSQIAAGGGDGGDGGECGRKYVNGRVGGCRLGAGFGAMD